MLPQISVTKVPDPKSLPEPGGLFTFTYVVTNNSVEDVTLTSVTDDVLGTIALPADVTLSPGEKSAPMSASTTYTEAGVYPNEVTAKAEDNEGNEATATAEAQVEVTDVLPQISVTKVPDPKSLPEPGGLFTFTYVVTNNSVEDVTLTSVTDDVLGTIALPADVTLSPGEKSAPMSASTTYTEAGVYPNEVTAKAEDNEGNEATATAEAQVEVTDVLPQISVTKVPDPKSLPEPGGLFTFTYVVTNNSVEDVTLTSVTDDVLGTIALPADVTLSPGEKSAPMSASTTYTEAGVYPNEVTAKAEDNEGNEATATAEAQVEVTDVLPQIQITKTADVHEVPTTGAWVTYTFVVKNLSVEPIMVTSVVDDKFGDLSTEAGVPRVLGVGGSFSFDVKKWIEGPAGDHTNVVTVEGRDNEGNTATDDDDETVVIRRVAIDVEKEISLDNGTTWLDADAPNGLDFLAGSPILYRFVVTNTGTADLSNVVLKDSVLGIDVAIGDLAAGASINYAPSAGSKVAVGDHFNEAVVTGDWHDNPATDKDDVAYFGDCPKIHIDKVTNGSDGPEILEGKPVTWTYTVTNVGNVALDDIVVTDDQGVTPAYQSGDKNGDGYLDLDETWVYEAKGTAIAGSYENTGTATGDFWDDAKQLAQPSDSDDSCYFGVRLALAIDKTTTGCDRTGDGVTVNVKFPDGTINTVTWNYKVTNNSNVDLTNIVVTDDKQGAVGTIAFLAKGASTTLHLTKPATQGTYTNWGYADATYKTWPVSAKDDSGYKGVVPAIDVEKLIRVNGGEWKDADAWGLKVYIDRDTVEYKFVVTNTGDADLTDVKVTDDMFGDIGTVALLKPGAANAVSFTRGPESPSFDDFGKHVNTATATGVYTCGEHKWTYCDQDKVYYEACYYALTPGYWKNHTEVWDGTNPAYTGPYFPDTWLIRNTVDAAGNIAMVVHPDGVFDIPAEGYVVTTGAKRKPIPFGEKDLLSALYFKGGPSLNGAAQTLFRAATAGLLNATHDYTSPKTDYPMTASEIITQVNAALASMDRYEILDLAATLDAYNNGL